MSGKSSCSKITQTSANSLEHKISSFLEINFDKRLSDLEIQLDKLRRNSGESKRSFVDYAGSNFTDLLTQLRIFRSDFTQARNGLMIPRSVSLNFEANIGILAPNMIMTSSTMDDRLIASVEETCAYIDEAVYTAGLPSEARRVCLGPPGNPVDPMHRNSLDHCRQVWREYLRIRHTLPTESQINELRTVAFNNWNYSEVELLRFTRYMLVGFPSPSNSLLKLTHHCKISEDVLDAWICLLFRYYNPVPFHNFKHAFMVAQMMFATINIAHLYDYFPPQDLFILLFSALCHDLDHPGFNNAYQINVRSSLATIYNDHSPLENHHCAMAFILCQASGKVNMLGSFSRDESLWIRKAVVSCILSTDMSMHAQILNDFRQSLPEFLHAASSTARPTLLEETAVECTDEDSQEDDIDAPESVLGIQRLLGRSLELRKLLMCMLLKLCDISNEIREPPVSGPWLDCLLKEFFEQADVERSRNLPVAPFMDPKLVTKSTSQCGFIRSSLMPLLEEICKLFPSLKKPLLNGAERQLVYYNSLAQETSQPQARNAEQVKNISQMTAEEVNCSPRSRALSHSAAQTRLLAEYLLHPNDSNLHLKFMTSKTSIPEEGRNLPFKCQVSGKRPMRASASDVPFPVSQAQMLEEEAARLAARRNSTSRVPYFYSKPSVSTVARMNTGQSHDFAEILIKHQASYNQQACCNPSRSLSPPANLFGVVEPIDMAPADNEDKSRKSSTGSMVLAS